MIYVSLFVEIIGKKKVSCFDRKINESIDKKANICHVVVQTQIRYRMRGTHHVLLCE